MQNGLAILHSNHLETLAEAAFSWCQREPLAPLENELFLVQSNGMADWLKLKMAQHQGITAAVDFPMPASYLWRLYRTVLSEDLSFQSPFDKGSLQWRIFTLLPTLLEQAEFERPRQFLLNEQGEIEQQKLFQLSRKVADLFDQYQQYRGDWLLSWQANQTIQLEHKTAGFAKDEAWQMRLWQALLEQIAESELAEELSRAQLHESFKQALAKNHEKLPRRIIVFGLNSLSEQIFDALCSLAPYCQILMLVLNPSEVFWQLRSGEEEINHPLLDSWGARGRDFTKLLDEHYEALPDYQKQQINQAHIYLGKEVYEASRQGSILFELQQAMQANQPIAHNEKLPLPEKPGLAFYPAFSRQREVEVLHDQLLALFDQNPDLSYHDVIVMMPDVEQYASAVHAVFGRYAYSDSRHLHYSISDRNNLIENPLFAALDYLLALPDKRLLQSEVFFLLEQEAIRQAFSLSFDEVEQIKLWVEQSQIRWGFDAEHKQEILNSSELEDWRNNTWQQGLDRLLAGYVGGDATLWGQESDKALCDGIAIDEVSANQGIVLGRFIHFMQSLNQLRKQLKNSYWIYAPEDSNQASWMSVFSSLLTRFFAASSPFDEDVISLLEKALLAWRENLDSAQCNLQLNLSIARSAWLEQVRNKGLSQSLSFNGVMFCTLMPMRALPFKHVFLLGMNDGDYPREQIPPDFDLMQYAFRTGDRDRRSDDQYLFLEALLSVRDSLSISWVGKDITDSSEKLPSTLVSQLQDYIDRVYNSGIEGKTASELLTHATPLAAFSPSYFDKNSPSTRTYANEWRALFDAEQQSQKQEKIHGEINLERFELSHLVALLKQPCSVFYRYGLGVYYPKFEVLSDDEPFENNGLVRWQIRHQALQANAEYSEINLNALKRTGQLQAGFYTDKMIAAELNTAASIQQRFEEDLGDAKAIEEHVYRLSLYDVESGLSAEVSGVLANLWKKSNKVILAEKTATHIGSNKAWRLEKVADFWLSHLIASSLGLVEESYLTGLSTTLKFPVLSAEDARYLLNQLFAVYVSALQQPLPLAPLSAAAYINVLEKDLGDEEVKSTIDKAFTSSRFSQGDDADAYVAAAFSEFDTFWQEDGQLFKSLVELVYLPLHQQGIAFKKEEAGDE